MQKPMGLFSFSRSKKVYMNLAAEYLSVQFVVEVKGENREQAIANIREAIEGYLESLPEEPRE